MHDVFAEYKAKLKAAKAELLTAGPIHAKDLRRQIHRMEKELRTYIRYQKQARIADQRATVTEGKAV
jgi:hypothetical protein